MRIIIPNACMGPTDVALGRFERAWKKRGEAVDLLIKLL